MVTDRRVLDLQPLAELECLGEIARRHPHLVAILAQALDQRPHDEDMRAVRQVDPDAHLRRTLTGRRPGRRQGCPADGYRCGSMLVLASISESVVNVAWHFVRDAGLPAVFLLMVAESACIPIPSEATMLFAGFAVADPGGSAAHHHLTLIGIVLAGVLGNLVGSWITYAIGYYGGRPFVERWGKYVLLRPHHLETAQRAHRTLRLALGRAKGREIVRAQQKIARPLHRRDVQGAEYPAGAPVQQGRAHGIIQYPVLIVADPGTETRVEFLGHPARPAHGNLSRKVAVYPADPRLQFALTAGIEMHHLATGVDTGIGATRADRGKRLIGKRRQRRLEHVLHRAPVQLGLPSLEG